MIRGGYRNEFTYFYLSVSLPELECEIILLRCVKFLLLFIEVVLLGFRVFNNRGGGGVFASGGGYVSLGDDMTIIDIRESFSELFVVRECFCVDEFLVFFDVSLSDFVDCFRVDERVSLHQLARTASSTWLVFHRLQSRLREARIMSEDDVRVRLIEMHLRAARTKMCTALTDVTN